MHVTEIYGCRVFDDRVMKRRLPPEAFESLKSTRDQYQPLDSGLASIVAAEMMNWAVEQGATHYTHWFQPMTNITAGKHDSFITPTEDGGVILEFSPSALIKGEPDASSFPSGGLRTTFEARGYTYWDPTSPAFVKDGTLYIPTAFCSYTGESLDTKTPLLRSMQSLSRQAVRALRLLGNTSSKAVIPTVGAEQEYFLIDRDKYEARLDLKICGRTLFGAKPPKGQQLDDHYCGRIRLRVQDFMTALDEELWRYGVACKTKHNEAAPAQHELACVYTGANTACDQNQLIMETMRIVAKQRGLACLLHEKPFEGVNGSGKHNNYSLSTDDGINLLSPGKDPAGNPVFLLFLSAFIAGLNQYSDLLRLSAASAGNDCRLGGYEAPPAVISMFLGGPLTEMLQDIAAGEHRDRAPLGVLQTGVNALPDVARDDADRNRTSPFAFTGNKFEFRMVGASQSVALSTIVLNTVLADVLEGFCQRLEQAGDRQAEVRRILADTVRDHGRIIFNGNNYADAWLEEAARRGLPFLRSAVEAIDTLVDPKNVALFARQQVFSEVECRSRHEIMLENYQKVVEIEAATMLEMVKKQIYPACVSYIGHLASAYNSLAAAGVHNRSMHEDLGRLSQLLDAIDEATVALERAVQAARQISDLRAQAGAMHERVLPAMQALRGHCDAIETLVDEDFWPMPNYTDLLHRV